MADLLALSALVVWPVIPLFWIPLHAAPGFFRKLGIITYLMPPLTWLPVAYLIYKGRSVLIHYRIGMPFVVQIAGVLLLFLGLLLHIWTGRLLGIWGLIGLPEVSPKIKGELVARGPFGLVRHPTYLAHTSIFLGVFLVTGVIAVGFLALLDFAAVNVAIIPLEERELIARFGSTYEEYMKRVPRLFPMKSRRPFHHP
jgi:protein-S-isoprenylcysteine O-methyltransferase Ste14